MLNYGHVHNGHAYATLTHSFFKFVKKINLSIPPLGMAILVLHRFLESTFAGSNPAAPAILVK